MCLRVKTEGAGFRDLRIGEGQMYLLPGGIPHNPIRFADTIGLVIERRRVEGQHTDCLRWYCEACEAVVYEETFFVRDIDLELKAIIEKYSGDEGLRTCRACGHLNPTQRDIN